MHVFWRPLWTTGLQHFLALASLIVAGTASAELVDNIELTDIRDTGVARLRLLAPATLDKYHPTGESQNVLIQLKVLNGAGAANLRREQQKRSRPTSFVPGFRMKSGHFPGCDTSPESVCVSIQFDEPANYRIEISADRRTLMLIFPKRNSE